MRRTWLVFPVMGIAAMAMWPNEAMARWYACQTDGSREYATALFEVPEGSGNALFERIKDDFRNWLRNNPRFPNARNDAYKYGLVLCDEKEFFERRIDPDRHVPTGWKPSMGRGTGASATPAPRRSIPTAPPLPAPAPLANEVANSARLNAQQAAAAKRQREQIEATVAAKRAADAKYLRDKAAADAKYLRDKAAVEAENARRAAAFKAAQADYERKLAEHKVAVEAQKGRKSAKAEDCVDKTGQIQAYGQAKLLDDARSAALRDLERQKSITIQRSNTLVSTGTMSCKGGPTRAGGVEMETDYSCTIPIVVKAKVCTVKPASASKQ